VPLQNPLAEGPAIDVTEESPMRQSPKPQTSDVVGGEIGDEGEGFKAENRLKRKKMAQK
jgi:hypothetical protein